MTQGQPDGDPQDAAPADAEARSSAPPRRLHTEAIARRGRWPGVVWAIPLAALLVTAYLGVQAIANRGVEVMVTFKSSGGAQAGNTPVIYKGVTVGHVVRIGIAENSRDVQMTLRLESAAKPHMREGAKFWLIGAETSLTDLSSSLKAVVSGVAIGVSPGEGAPATHFVGLDQPPAVPPDTPGTLYILDGAQIGNTTAGSGVFYHGLLVGRVTRVGVTDSQTMHLVIFINAPFDRLVNAGTLFFNASAGSVSLSAGQINASLGPGTSAITGGVEFWSPIEAAGAPKRPPNTQVHFFAPDGRARNQPPGPEVRYSAAFRAASQLPQTDAPVWLGGERIGRVLKARIALPPGALAPVTRVELEIEPQKLALPTARDVRATTDEGVRNLIRGGYRLTMAQYPPLIGTATLLFQRTPGAAKAALTAGDAPLIPTASATGLDDLTSKAGDILAKVDALPIAEIGRDVRRITSRVSRLIASPEIDDSLHKLDSTLTSVDQIAREAKPQVGPLIAKLNQVADEVGATASAAEGMLSGDGAGQDASLPDAVRQLTDAARSIRALADYLGRHPEAVLRGKVKEAH